MSNTFIFHNPRCSKSRRTLEILKGTGLDFEIRSFFKDPKYITLEEKITNTIEIILFVFNFSFKKRNPNKTLNIGKIK